MPQTTASCWTRKSDDNVPAEYHQTTWATECALEFLTDAANKDGPWMLNIKSRINNGNMYSLAFGVLVSRIKFKYRSWPTIPVLI